MASRKSRVAVYLEAGQKRVVVAARDWPGWCRISKSEELALELLASYAERYAEVAKVAGVDFGPTVELEVVERRKGTGATDFGIPAPILPQDDQPLTGKDLERVRALVNAAWTVLDQTAQRSPQELRKGPRGGGRDRDKMLDHVYGAESGYARQMRVRFEQPALDDRPAIDAAHAAIIEALGQPRPDEKAWSARYAARRIAWHVLDHAWEMADRST